MIATHSLVPICLCYFVPTVIRPLSKLIKSAMFMSEIITNRKLRFK